MPEGGELQFRLSKISVSPGSEAISRDMQPGDWVAVTVADSGSGIPPAVRAHIFEPFFTTKGISKGTGLGLSQVYGIVKQHKGFIDVQTETGKGTGFIIYLPSMDEPSGATGKDNVKSIPKGHGETILVAEDDNEVLELFRAVFAELGYKLLAASNGKDAVNVFQKHLDEINLVITDLIMPEMGGIELSERLKKLKPSLKIIALSGYPFEVEDWSWSEKGIDELMDKPIDIPRFAEMVRKYLSEI